MTAQAKPVLQGRKRHYTDPYRGRLPELERCTIRHRALQMILIIYHAEELKRSVVETVESQGHWKKAVSEDNHAFEEVPGRKKVKHAFDYLVNDGVITEDERWEMVKLIGRRNSIAHHLDEVNADLSTDTWIREQLPFMPERKEHDYEALNRLKAMRRLLEERTVAKHYVGVISMRGVFFQSTERALRNDITRLDRRIRKLIRERRAAILKLNEEISLEGTELVGIFDPRWPENRDHRGRLTPRGVEFCSRLFDMGKSIMAVAHIMELSLSSARVRADQWRDLGGNKRPARNLEDIPPVRISVRYDDIR